MKKARSKSLSSAQQSPATEQIRNGQRLARATKKYFDSLSAEAIAEENAIAQSLGLSGISLSADLEN